MKLQAKITTGVGVLLVAGGVAIGMALSGGSTKAPTVIQQVDQPIAATSTAPASVASTPIQVPTDTITTMDSTPSAASSPAAVVAPPVHQAATAPVKDDPDPGQTIVNVDSLSPGQPVPPLLQPGPTQNPAPPQPTVTPGS